MPAEVTFRNLLVPMDFSAHSERALECAIDLAEKFDARLHLLHAYHLPLHLGTPDQIVIPQDFWTSVRDAARRRLEEALERATSRGVQGEIHLSEMSATQAIEHAAERLSADLIVMGTHGRTGLRHVLLGSVAERTIRAAPCPVLTVKGEDP